MAELSIALLGSPRVERDGEPVVCDTRKAVALLAYLAVTGQSHGRDSLTALLWPDYDPDRGRASLRRTLSVLLKALDGRWIAADRRTVGLDRAGVRLDVERFGELLAGARATDGGPQRRVVLLRQAASLYRGEFLAGFALRDSPEFDDWQFFTADGLRRDLAGALERLVVDCAATGAVEEAISHARRWLALDALHEPAHRHLMLLYARSGQRAAALRQYRECVRILDRELGVPPLEETSDLYRAVKEGRVAPPAAAPPVAPGPPAAAGAPARQRPPREGAEPGRAPAGPLGAGPPAAAPPLVGRRGEFQALVAAHGQAGEGRLLAVEGEAGVGKTRLLEELAAHVRDRGGTVVVVRCFEGEQRLAYSPFVSALRAVVDGLAGRPHDLPAHWWAEVSRLLPEVAARAGPGGGPQAGDGPGAQARFFEAVRGVLLAGLVGPVPGLLVVDDAHWADEASLDLLGYLVRRLPGTALCVALSWRSELVEPGHRLRRAVRETRAAGAGAALALGRLSADDVDRLADRLAPGMAPELRARLYAETEGLPFFVVQYLAATTPSGDARAWPLPGGVRDLLGSRVEGLDATARQLLTTAAVVGRSFDLGTLRSASGRGEEETVAGLETLLARALLREHPGAQGDEPEYDFTHHKLRVHVVEATSLARRRLLHRRVAEALAERARGRRETAALRAQIAVHHHAAGDDATAAEDYARAGQEARAAYANGEALGYFGNALALGHPDAAALHEAIGDLHTLAGAYDEAVASYETAASLADPARLGPVEHKLGSVHHRNGDWDLADDHLQAALDLLPADDAAGRARVVADRALNAHRRGDADAARALAGQASSLAETGGDALALAQAHNLLGMLATARGDVGVALEHLEAGLEVARRSGDLAVQAAALNNLALAHRAAGQTRAALPLAEAALAIVTRLGDRHRQAAIENNLGDLLRSQGRTEEAEARIRRAVGILAEIGADARQLRPEIWKLTEW